MELRTLTGRALDAVLDDLARLRIKVFADFPYLYDGDFAYERRYLEPYRANDGAIVVGAFEGDRLVGAATGMPLMGHSDDFAAAFADSEIDLGDVFYCAESVLLPEFRGRGIGHAFFEAREAHARELGFGKVAFCAVVRGEHHMEPKGYRPLDPFWRGRGYIPLEGVIAQFRWRDLGEDSESSKALQFWLREL